MASAEALAGLIEQALYEVACGPAGEELDLEEAPHRDGRYSNGDDRWTMLVAVGGGRKVRIRLEETR